jgi:hypothetical protein
MSDYRQLIAMLPLELGLAILSHHHGCARLASAATAEAYVSNTGFRWRSSPSHARAGPPLPRVGAAVDRPLRRRGVIARGPLHAGGLRPGAARRPLLHPVHRAWSHGAAAAAAAVALRLDRQGRVASVGTRLPRRHHRRARLLSSSHLDSRGPRRRLRRHPSGILIPSPSRPRTSNGATTIRTTDSWTTSTRPRSGGGGGCCI